MYSTPSQTYDLNESIALLRDPAILERTTLTDLCGLVADELFEFSGVHGFAFAFSREDSPYAGLMRALLGDLRAFWGEYMGDDFVCFILDHLSDGKGMWVSTALWTQNGKHKVGHGGLPACYRAS